MNAREKAIEQARCYWNECGLFVGGFALDAHQTPLPGSVWWVEARAAGVRHDLLVHRLDKATFRCVPHRPYGYTVYACYKGSETPLVVVEYEAQARDAIASLQKSLLYAHTSLCFVANPSAEWAEATRALLAEKVQRQGERRLREADREEGISQLLSHRVIEQVRARCQERESDARDPYPQDIFDLLDAAIRAKNPHGFVHHREATQTFLASRMRQGACQPFGWLWTKSDCLLLTPGDAISQQSLFASRRWKRVKYSFYFDGESLQECASLEELRQILGFDY